jgi:hypothetical protein
MLSSNKELKNEREKIYPSASAVSLDEIDTIVKPTKVDKQSSYQQLTTSSKVRKIPPIEQNS